MDSRYLDTILNSFYKNGYEEDERLTSDKMHYVEFITTTNYIDKYLKPGDRILEIGAGAGAYSLHYAKKGFQVDALELVQANVDVMKSKITDDMNINAVIVKRTDRGIEIDRNIDLEKERKKERRERNS